MSRLWFVQEHRAAVAAISERIGPEMPIHRYSDYLARRFDARTYRVSVDAGFTCPVRNHGRPCTYCDVRGSRSPYLGELTSLNDQVNRGMSFLRRRYGAQKFLLYFQAFSNTFAPTDVLRRVYDAGLGCGDFIGLIVGTRPDCIDEPRAALLAEYRERGLDTWVELGLQSACDSTLRRVRRGHSVAEFDRAVGLLHDYGLLVAAHVILGLPNERGTEVVETARHLTQIGVEAVKFHNLVITEGTELHRDYLAGLVVPPSVPEYTELLIAALEHTSPDIVAMRLTCDPPRDIGFVPDVLPNKATFYETVTAEMKRRNTWQGRCVH